MWYELTFTSWWLEISAVFWGRPTAAHGNCKKNPKPMKKLHNSPKVIYAIRPCSILGMNPSLGGTRIAIPLCWPPPFLPLICATFLCPGQFFAYLSPSLIALFSWPISLVLNVKVIFELAAESWLTCAADSESRCAGPRGHSTLRVTFLTGNAKSCVRW